MKRCVALFNDGWADWEAGPVLAALREHMGWQVSIATPKGDDATSIGGIRARADFQFGTVNLKETDLLLVIGSAEWFDREFPEVYSLMASAVQQGVPLGAICGATVAAARAGILDERKHTSNSLETLTGKAPQYKGSAFYQDVVTAISDRGVVTASGNSPQTFAAEIIRLVDKKGGDELASEYLKYARMEHQTAEKMS